MEVRTIPAIEEMTPAQRVELMEELWRVMSKSPSESEPPAWHNTVLEERRQAVKNGEVEYLDFDDVKSRLEGLIK
ncbi:MAG: addiction module protein [Acidobacteria bacterium]|nr:addiction module protein [Acidobacteriota bacterium]